ncbi:hypothetical protein RB2501_01485 [Robiginitalea biformata HTCC2501]|uniref:DUF4468 domain-containing protein n=2 Tax=Robiginitalea TaxID=252306 RepID=A4CPX2_ROBBH|nr:hypothetical protein RB2501_01485 [Robiginitalea biformata HTCC2501]
MFPTDKSTKYGWAMVGGPPVFINQLSTDNPPYSLDELPCGEQELFLTLGKIQIMRTLLVFLMCCGVAWGQVEFDGKGNFSLSQVHEVNGSRSDLQKWATEWAAKTYNNSNYVTRINDDDQILTKGSFEVPAIQTINGKEFTQGRRINYTLNVQFKEGRYKIDITDVALEQHPSYPDRLQDYFLGKEEYRNHLRRHYGPESGAELKSMTRLIENDRKYDELYTNIQKYGRSMVIPITVQIEKINQSLLAYMKQDHSDDDW